MKQETGARLISSSMVGVGGADGQASLTYADAVEIHGELLLRSKRINELTEALRAMRDAEDGMSEIKLERRSPASRLRYWARIMAAPNAMAAIPAADLRRGADEIDRLTKERDTIRQILSAALDEWSDTPDDASLESIAQDTVEALRLTTQMKDKIERAAEAFAKERDELRDMVRRLVARLMLNYMGIEVDGESPTGQSTESLIREGRALAGVD